MTKKLVSRGPPHGLVLNVDFRGKWISLIRDQKNDKMTCERQNTKAAQQEMFWDFLEISEKFGKVLKTMTKS